MTQFPDNIQSNEPEFHGQEAVAKAGFGSMDDPAEVNRRRFLEAAGFSLSVAAMGGCGRAPVETALPFPSQPVGAIPGRLQNYASTCAGCPSGCGLLVGTRDGRPLKMEGLPKHPLSDGGLCAVGQAQPISLYDSKRLTGPLLTGKPSDWATIDQEILQALGQIKAQKKSVRLVTPTITSPTLQTSIDKFLAPFEDAKHIVFDAVSSSAILDAHQQTHSARLLPHYRLDRADVLVSFGADFLGTWISPVEFTAAWAKRRAPSEDSPVMSYHVQIESRMSLTGTNADRRVAIHPRDQGPLVGRLAEKVAVLAGKPHWEKLAIGADDSHEKVLDELAKRLWDARGKCLVVSDSQDIGTQRVVNYLNHLLGNYGTTLDLENPSYQRQGNDSDVEKLVEELVANQVGALLVADVDLLHDLTGSFSLAEAIGRVPLTVSFAPREDEFAAAAKFVCPDHHALESWADAMPTSGLMSLAQPTLRPLGKTRALLESLAAWSGQPTTAYDALRAYWEAEIFPARSADAPGDFLAFWERTLLNGFAEIKPDQSTVGKFVADSIKPLDQQKVLQKESDAFSLVLYSKVGMPDSRHAHNPWLHELPDPVTKVTWGNYACLSPGDAEKLGVKNGDVIKVSAGEGRVPLELPTLVQMGQHDGVLAIALAYGCKGTDRFAKVGPQWFEARPTVPTGERLGKNAASLVEFRDGSRQTSLADVTLTKTKSHRELAITQKYHSLNVPAEVAPHGAEHREIVERTTLPAFAKDAHSGAAEHHFEGEKQLWPEDHEKTGHAWGMVIDLNKCTGCSACVVACQSENNVPVVGYDEVRRQREMHWMRIDRYYTSYGTGEGEEMDIDHQPMMCQHCDNAPCETVCPVLATVHSDEGLNEQVYNRCVGTRYCANNCPYKVRRFNWFKYPHDDTLQNLVLNPEVTVRSRGVMEKCSMCVQRIEAGKVEARSHGSPVADGAIQTACQQSCPAEAIVFGDMNDPKSQVRASLENPRGYRVLEELNVRPAVSYLRVVKNTEENTDEMNTDENKSDMKKHNGGSHHG
ncbi:MAG: 4Fe-4S dicluster domain-containing protein [Planctomycetes bacterium]|nr:4Fe-4S dicluster domain-containing protein [Planctomycetota bacterium]